MHPLHDVSVRRCLHLRGNIICLTQFASNNITWHNLCSELRCIGRAIAAQQHDGVGKRGWRPGSVIPSRQTVIVFYYKKFVVKVIIGRHLIV